MFKNLKSVNNSKKSNLSKQYYQPNTPSANRINEGATMSIELNLTESVSIEMLPYEISKTSAVLGYIRTYNTVTNPTTQTEKSIRSLTDLTNLIETIYTKGYDMDKEQTIVLFLMDMENAVKMRTIVNNGGRKRYNHTQTRGHQERVRRSANAIIQGSAPILTMGNGHLAFDTETIINPKQLKVVDINCPSCGKLASMRFGEGAFCDVLAPTCTNESCEVTQFDFTLHKDKH